MSLSSIVEGEMLEQQSVEALTLSDVVAIPDVIPDADQQRESIDFMETLLKERKCQPSKFESYWEKDENDIDSWTNEEIEGDERKQLLTFAESSYSDVFDLMNKDLRSLESQRELLSYEDDDGYTALHRAAYTNNLQVAKYLLSFEKEPGFSDLRQLDRKTEMGWTPLHSAAFWNSYEIVDYFVKIAKADVNSQTSGGQTALHLCASKSDCMETLLILLTHPSANFKIVNEQNETALEIANRSCKFNGLFEIAQDNLNII